MLNSKLKRYGNSVGNYEFIFTRSYYLLTRMDNPVSFFPGQEKTGTSFKVASFWRYCFQRRASIRIIENS